MQSEETVERRIVTVLFADLVGFTTLSEQYDPEDIAQIQDRYFAVVRETVGRYGGRLEKFIGDAAMAVFGVPRARDDDAQRAVRAALALTHAVQLIGAELGLEDGVLRLRVGVNTGEAVIAASGDDEGRVTGDTVNTAARLQTAAPPGEVMVGPTTALAIADWADMDQPSPFELKGKAEPISARVVRGFAPEPSREQAMGDLRAPTIGRQAEVDALVGALAQARSSATLRRVVIAPPGVGKSRLLRELAERPETSGDTLAVWRTRARPDSTSVFEPIAGLMLAALGSAADDRSTAEELLRDRLRDAGASDLRAGVVAQSALDLLWPAEVNLGEGQSAEDRETRFGAWLDALDALAGSATQLWLVEDVHWAGGDVLAFVAQAGERATSHGRLVVATARPSLLESSSDWAGTGEEVLQLATLESSDAGQLVRALVGDALPEDLVVRIVERSDGNCLFIEELLRSWVSVGTLVRDQGANTWRLAIPAEDVPLPASVQSIYAAQLDDLPPDARRVARRASVAGRRFPVRALEPLEAQASGLEPLKRRALVAGPLSEPVLGDAFAYRHALLRDAGYASLARAERARLHVRLARWLEQAAGDRQNEVAEQIAGHYSAALESAPALSAEIGEGLGKDQVRTLAAEWYERAGQATLSLSAHDAARSLLKRSIELTPEESRLDQARRWERLGDATAFAADMDEGAAAYQRAIELYRAAMTMGSEAFDRGSDALETMAQGMEQGGAALQQRLNELGQRLGIPNLGEGMSSMADGAAELRSGAQEIQQDKRQFERDMAVAGLARATSELANVWYQQLRFDEARQLADSALSELGEMDDVSRARLLLARGHNSQGASGPSPDAMADLEQAVELAQQSGDAQAELRARNVLTGMRSETGDAEVQEWREIADRAAELGQWAPAVTALMNVALSEMEHHPARVPELLRPARELATAHGATDDVAWTWYFAAEAHFQTGDWDAAVAAGREALDIGEANAYRRVTVRTVHVMVPIAAARGDHEMLERAAAFYRSLEGKFEFPDSPYARIIQPAQEIELAKVGLAEQRTYDVEPRLPSFRDAFSDGSWLTAVDGIVRAWIESGEVDGAARAIEVIDASQATWTTAGPLADGTQHLVRARVGEARGDAALATKEALAALDRFRTATAPWWVAKAIRLLERLDAADESLRAEASAIDLRLGVIRPTE